MRIIKVFKVVFVVAGITAALFNAAGAAREPRSSLRIFLDARGDGALWDYRITYRSQAKEDAEIVLELYNEKKQKLKTIFNKKYPSGTGIKGRVDLTPYGKGAYRILAKAYAGGKETAGREEKIYYLDAPWKNIDMELKEVPYPWTPVKLKGKGTLTCWGREYRLGKNLLPDSIISQSEEILAGPVSFDVRQGGKALSFRFSAAKTVTEKATKIVRSTRGNCVEIKNLSVKTVTTLEFDGILMIDITMRGKSLNKVSDISIRIPLRGDAVRYLRTVGRTAVTLGIDDSLIIKPEKDGIILKKYFSTFLLTGNDDIGLCWFVNSNRDWPNSLAGSRDAIVAENKGKEVVLRFKILKKGQTIKGKRFHFRFGLQATPVKKLPSFIRKINRLNSTAVFPNPGLYKYPCYPLWSNETLMRKLIKQANTKTSGRSPCVYAKLMFPSRVPEWKVFGKRWHMDGGEDMTWIVTKRHGWPYDVPLMRPCMGSDYNKYFAYMLAGQMEKYNIHGYFWDGAFWGGCRNPYHGHGDGGALAFPYEDTVRFFRYLYARGKKMYGSGEKGGFQWMHGETATPPSIYAYADMVMVGEGYNAVKDNYLDVVSLDDIRAGWMGKQWGYAVQLIPQFGKRRVNRKYVTPKNTRGMMGLLLLHDVGVYRYYCHPDTVQGIWNSIDSGFDYEDAEFYPYFKESTPAKVKGKDVYVSLYRKPDGKVMAVVANLSKQNLRTKVTFDLKKLGLKRISKCLDIENNISLVPQADSVKVVVRANDFRLLVIE